MAQSEKFRPMVGWFDPRQLLGTAGRVIVSSIIGRHADRRLIEDLATQPCYADFTASPEEKIDWKEEVKHGGELMRKPCAVADADKEFWIDYVSDVGDGWNATYAVAHRLVQPELKVQDDEGNVHRLKRGSILIFGGDEVYPTANRDQYREGWERPYSDAFQKGPAKKARPYAFAIPGNHDWYDSLASFSEMFSGSYVNAFPESAEVNPEQGGWETPQNRSYFALKLPYRWWVFGLDLQLNHDLDEAQLKYFGKVLKQIEQDDDDERRRVAKQVKESDADPLVAVPPARIILCSPEPFWVYTNVFEEAKKAHENSRLHALIKRVGEKRIAVYLAGDLHHYYSIRDLNDKRGPLRITAGGGGAFMHPTHGKEGHAFAADKGYQVHAYPDHKTSRSLAWGNLWFLRKNPWFGLVTGILYLLTAWLMLSGVSGWQRDLLLKDAGDGWQSFTEMSTAALNAGMMVWGSALFESPFLGFLAIAVLAGFVAFTDANAKWYRFVGALHGLLHLACAGLIGWLGLVVYVKVAQFFGVSPLDRLPGLTTSSLSALLTSLAALIKVAWPLALGGLVATLLISIAGVVIGSFLMGIYLLFSLNLFGYHTGEGSSLKVENYKNFLRMKLAEDGSLTIYSIGLDAVPRWEKKEWEEVKPDDQQPSRYMPRRGLPQSFEPRLIEAPLKYPLA